MNFQTAAITAGAAFLLSLAAGLLGGVPFFDVLIRALFWGALGFGGCLGAEALLRSLVPDLFTQAAELGDDSEPVSERTVDITLGDDEQPSRGGFVEEVDQGAGMARILVPEPVVRTEAAGARETEQAQGLGSPPEATGEPQAADDEMPEISSFLDAFKPGAPDEDGGTEGRAPSPELGEYTPVEPAGGSQGDMTRNGEVQDPVILAKAVQTVMKRDGQGN